MSISDYYALLDEEPCNSENQLEKSLRGREGLSESRSIWGSRWMAGINACLLVVSLVTLILSWSRIAQYTTKDANTVLEQASFYSPLFSRYQIRFENRVFSGSLFAEENLSSADRLLRSSPSPEVDAAWDALAHVSVVTISTSEVEKLGKNPYETVKAPLDWGLGPDAHLAQIDGQHALHCLNTVRRYAYREHYFPHMNTCNETGASPLNAVHQAHLSHCLHVLLQTLTCNPSLDIITHNWVETQDYPFPDFSINKKCIDHTQLLQWQSNNGISDDQWDEMAKRGPAPGEITKSMPEQLRKWSESENERKSDMKMM